MPVYEYVENGRIVERAVPVDQRDAFPGRLTVPRRVSVCPRGKPSQGSEVLRGLYREESKPGAASGLHRCMGSLGLNPSQVKDVWDEGYKVRPGPHDGEQ